MADPNTTIPSRDEILRYLELNEAACSFEAQMHTIRGYGAFDRSTMQMPDPTYVKVATWLRDFANVNTSHD